MILEYPNIEGNGEIYLDLMRAICGDTAGKSMVDLMCHKAPYTPQLGFERRTYVDIQFRGLDFKEEEKYFIEADVLDYLETCISSYEDLQRKVFDVAIASDSIEHLLIKDGQKLITLMMATSFKQVIFTPNGSYAVEEESINPDAHKSGWNPSYFNEIGWLVVVFPGFHKQLNIGAFFAINSSKKELFEIKERLDKLSYLWS